MPNHASVAEPESENPAWCSVLRDGQASPQASWFDIDWDSRDNPGKVLVPVLGSSLADASKQVSSLSRATASPLRSRVSVGA